MVLITKDRGGMFHLHEVEINTDFTSIRVPCIIRTHVAEKAWLSHSVHSTLALDIKLEEYKLNVGRGIQFNNEMCREFCKNAA